MKLLNKNYTVLLIILLLGTMSLSADDRRKHSEPETVFKSVMYYLTHTMAAAAAYRVGSEIMFNAPSLLGRTPLWRLSQEEALYRISSALCAGMAVAYGTYKLPEWTDAYLLGLNKTRTTKQNRIRFFHHIFLGPLGALTGEYLAENSSASES